MSKSDFMDFKLIVALAMAALGVAVGIYELFQFHWIAAISAICSGLIAAGIFVFGREFISESYIGTGLVVLVTMLGFYGLFFESRALDLKLNDARYEAAIELLRTKPICAGIPNVQEVFINASKACLIQSNRDQIDWVGDATKQIYLPQELGLIDAVHNSLKKQEEYPCSSWVSVIYAKCPDVFSTLQKSSMQRLLDK